MKAISLDAPKQFRRIDVPEPPPPGPGEAVVRAWQQGHASECRQWWTTRRSFTGNSTT